MADKKISALTAAALPLAGTEVLPIVQSGATVKVASDDLTVKNVRSNATTGILQIAGPAASTTRTMTVPNANFTAARTDAAQTFTGDQTLSAGNLAVGTAGKGLTTSSAISLGLGTNGSVTQATVTTGGSFLAGTTTDSGYHRFTRSNTSDWICAFVNSAATTPWGVIVNYSASAPNNTDPAVSFSDTGGERATIRNNGGLANYQANDVNLSDRREKTNFAPAKSYLDTICAIPVQTFEYIDQSSDDPGLTLGVVAQDVQAVAPELVMESNWGTADNPKMRLGIYQTDLQYALMKCIQEQQAIINSLLARVSALEGK